MIIPIEQVTIEVTAENGVVSDFVLEAPNSDDPFNFRVRRVKIRPDYRDKDFIFRLGEEKYELLFSYTYESHTMDLRKLLTARSIALKAPPDFAGDYQAHEVLLLNEDAVKDYFDGLAIGGETDAVPTGGVTLRFQTIEPLDENELLALKWEQGDTTIPAAPENVAVEIIGEADVFYSMNLNATDQYVNLTTLGAFGSQMFNYTWEVWFKTSNTADRLSIASTFNDGATTNFVSQLNAATTAAQSAGSIYTQIRNDSGTSFTKAHNSNAGFNDGAWHKLAVRVENGSQRMWIDGVEQSLSTAGSAPADNFSNFGYAFLLGGFNNRGTIDQRFFDGKLAFPALFTVAKSVSELENDWNLLPDTADPNIFATWFFREGELSTVADELGNHDGTLVPGSGSVDDMWDVDIPTLGGA